jgi:hypothetical protein
MPIMSTDLRDKPVRICLPALAQHFTICTEHTFCSVTDSPLDGILVCPIYNMKLIHHLSVLAGRSSVCQRFLSTNISSSYEPYCSLEVAMWRGFRVGLISQINLYSRNVTIVNQVMVPKISWPWLACVGTPSRSWLKVRCARSPLFRTGI